MDLGSYCDCPACINMWAGAIFQKTSIKKKEFQQMTGQTLQLFYVYPDWSISAGLLIPFTVLGKMFKCVDSTFKIVKKKCMK